MNADVYTATDLTARARIRDAAFALIAERGVHGATVRLIAERSNVSPSLVLHHYGSKQAVVDEVSRWVVHVLLRIEVTPQAHTGSPAEDMQARQELFDRRLTETPNLAGYLRRMLLDGQPEGIAWFNDSVQSAAQELQTRAKAGMARPSKDTEALAVLLMVMSMAPLMLPTLIEASLGIDFSSSRDRARWADAVRELLTSPLYDEKPVAKRKGRSTR